MIRLKKDNKISYSLSYQVLKYINELSFLIKASKLPPFRKRSKLKTLNLNATEPKRIMMQKMLTRPIPKSIIGRGLWVINRVNLLMR